MHYHVLGGRGEDQISGQDNCFFFIPHRNSGDSVVYCHFRPFNHPELVFEDSLDHIIDLANLVPRLHHWRAPEWRNE